MAYGERDSSDARNDEGEYLFGAERPMVEHPLVTLRKELQEVLDMDLVRDIKLDNATLSGMLAKRVEATGWTPPEVSE